MDVYVIMAEGAYLYDAQANTLKPVAPADVRQFAGTQAYAVADTAKLGGDDAPRLATANADTGFIAQNVYLFCASEGLGTVVRGSVNRTDLGKALNHAPAADRPCPKRGLRPEVRRQLNRR